MKKLLAACFAAAAICGVPALAADLAVKAPPPPPPPALSPPQHSDSASACPTNSARGAGLVEMAILFSVKSPRQNVTCIYADGSRTTFEVDRGCDIEPTDISADAFGASGGGFVSGFHECHESEAGGGKCHVICRH